MGIVETSYICKDGYTHDFLYDINEIKAQMVYESDFDECTVYIDGHWIKKFTNPDEAYMYLRKRGFEF